MSKDNMNNEIEKKIAAAVKAETPDILDDLLEEIDNGNSTSVKEHPAPEKVTVKKQVRGTHGRKPWFTVLAGIAAVMILFTGIRTMMNIQNEAFAVINRRCHSLLDFVESYRQLTRIKAPGCTTFSVSDLFANIKVLYPKVVTVLDGCPVESQLTADRSQLEQVLINLIKNAYESGATEVEVAANDSEIRIRDNGCGMSSDVLEHAFIPFFTTKPTGTGIGLSLCRQIILKHGGTIRVESEPDRGTTFFIKL